MSCGIHRLDIYLNELARELKRRSVMKPACLFVELHFPSVLSTLMLSLTVEMTATEKKIMTKGIAPKETVLFTRCTQKKVKYFLRVTTDFYSKSIYYHLYIPIRSLLITQHKPKECDHDPHFELNLSHLFS